MEPCSVHEETSWEDLLVDDNVVCSGSLGMCEMVD